MNYDQVIAFVTGKWCLSFKGWAYLTPLSAIALIGNSLSYYKISVHDTLLIILISTLSSTLVALLLNFTLLRNRRNVNQPISRVLIAYLIIWLSLVGPQSLFLFYHERYALNIGLSIFSQLVPIVSALFAFSYIFALNEKIFLDKSKIDFALDKLLIIQKEVARNNKEQVQKAINIVSDSIRDPLRSLMQQIEAMKSDKSKLLRISHDLEKYSEMIVRTSSHEMYFDRKKDLQIDRNIFRGNAPTNHDLRWLFSNINPLFTLIAIATVTGISQMSINGLSGLLFILALETALVPILVPGSYLLRRNRKDEFKKNAIVILAVLFISGAIVGLYSSFLLANKFVFTDSLYPAGISLRFISIIIASIFISSMIKTDVENYNKLIETNTILENEIKLIENVSKNSRAKIAKLLHGPIQGKIAGAVLALRIYASNDKTVAEEDIRNIKSLLSSIETDLNNIINYQDTSLKVNLDQSLETLKSNWGELLNIEIRKDLTLDLNVINNLQANILEVLDEAISNALRHGSASKVEIGLSLEKGCFTITVKDNGVGVGKNYKPGFGMGVYKENNFQFLITAGETEGSVLQLSTIV